MTYTWKITNIAVKDSGSLKNVVVQTHWQKIGKDEDGYEGIYLGATPFDISQVNPDSFINAEDLTEEQVLGWIKARIASSDIYEARINKEIQNMIDDKKNVTRPYSPSWLK